MRTRTALFASLLVLLAAPGAASACSSCSCSFNSEWASEGYAADPGFRLDLRYDYINQRELRQGSKAVSHSDFELPNDKEIPQHTITRVTLLGLDYVPTREWGFRAVVPFVDRTHSTILSGDTESTRGDTFGFGDTQLIARYQGFTSEANLGVQLGIKVPSGSFTDGRYDTHDDDAEASDQLFNPRHNGVDHGPLHEEGGRLDRGLQNGTGTTDLIFGVYKFGNLAPQTEYFVQALLNQPFAQRSDFRAGTVITTSVGASYQAADWVKPQLQLNYRAEAREEGELADTENSGGQSLKLTPGFSFYPTEDLIVYTLVEVPLLQDVNGLQIQPQAIYSAGLRVKF